jgi:hypothetical protein
MPLLDVQIHTTSLLSQSPWKSPDELKSMSRPELEGWRSDLKRRLRKEESTADALEQFIEETAEDDLFDEPPEEPAEEKIVEKVLPNPREGWEIRDYVRFLDTGAVGT